jgi:hypothetical protein
VHVEELETEILNLRDDPTEVVVRAPHDRDAIIRLDVAVREG